MIKPLSKLATMAISFFSATGQAKLDGAQGTVRVPLGDLDLCNTSGDRQANPPLTPACARADQPAPRARAAFAMSYPALCLALRDAPSAPQISRGKP